MGKTAEYYREYNRKHREEVNANSRLCYAVRTGKISGVRPDVAKERRRWKKSQIQMSAPNCMQHWKASPMRSCGTWG
jgi:predicted metalloendopeptidase